MTVLTSLGILVFSMLILAFLQLVPGVFALFSHYASGKYSEKKASDLALFYIFGVEIFSAVIFVLIYSLLSAFYETINDLNILYWILSGIFIAIGLIILFLYYKKGLGSKLFISRSLAKGLDDKALKAKTRSDAFVLGAVSIIPELIFTIPLYIISALSVMDIGSTPPARSSIIILYVFAIIAPLLILHLRKNYNLADYLRFRFKNKLFFKVFLSILYLILAILTITRITI